jgi:hypothetical protein
VLRMRLELIHLSAPPPQDGMSTNFTTAAFVVTLADQTTLAINEVWY